ncbi:sigma-54-dependent transcriptional regulator [Melioribacteraceae bacterium 4301-Me]|uniref:sigma-54-dependent transcriptional regulator n=1 Tax=Pyranulibacter aquaticus TaxID=3163344 RepID=UPI003598FE4C
MGMAIYPDDPVLLVDDETQFLFSAETALTANGINNVVTINDSTKVLPFLEKQNCSVIVLDINMPQITGLELLPLIVDKHPNIPVIILTAMNDVESAVKSIKAGAFNYILKPVDDTRLVTTIRSGINLNEMRIENTKLKNYLLKDKLEHPEAFNEIITKSSSMRAIFKYIEAIAKSPQPVLITGETGVGKEMIAKVIHKLSGRQGELVLLNVAGVDDNLFSDTLFGHKKGAFTGAENERKGLIEQADKGTLFLDEIGDLSLESQVKLLRLIQEGKYYQLGSDMVKLADVRIICATNADVDVLKEQNKFRKDLYYRLQTHQIHIPPLRERKGDIPFLVNHFLEKAAFQLNKRKPTPPKELFILLSNYDFPGNIRELEGIIFDAVSVHQSGILPLEPIREKIFSRMKSKDISNYNLQYKEEKIFFGEQLPTLDEAEEILIQEALKRTENNQTIAAELLGISRRALNNRLRRKIKFTH